VFFYLFLFGILSLFLFFSFEGCLVLHSSFVCLFLSIHKFLFCQIKVFSYKFYVLYGDCFFSMIYCKVLPNTLLHAFSIYKDQVELSSLLYTFSYQFSARAS